METFGQKITRLMQDKNITAQEIVKMIPKHAGITVKRIRGWENECILPSDYELKLIAGVFGVSIEDLNHIRRKSDLNPTKINPNIGKPDEKKIPLQKTGDMCIEPGCFKPVSGNCHLTGWAQFLFGKGFGKKCSNAAVAEYCAEHHAFYDQPNERKSDKLLIRFLIGIVLTYERKILDGRIILKK